MPAMNPTVLLGSRECPMPAKASAERNATTWRQSDTRPTERSAAAAEADRQR